MPIYLKQFTKFPNAGDVASGYLISRLLGTDTILSGETPLGRTNLVAMGSILHWADGHSIIWGSGLLSSAIILKTRPIEVAAVRGHLTRERLDQMGIPSPGVVGDPGILISDFFCTPVSAGRGIGIIPHYFDFQHPFVLAAQDRGAILINPLTPIEDYLETLLSCEVIISSSLHGIIFAHSFGIPAAWVRLSSKVLGDGFKFRDYYSSIGFAPNEIPDLTEAHSFERVVDHASLPRSDLDRNELRAALLRISARLQERTE